MRNIRQNKAFKIYYFHLACVWNDILKCRWSWEILGTLFTSLCSCRIKTKFAEINSEWNSTKYSESCSYFFCASLQQHQKPLWSELLSSPRETQYFLFIYLFLFLHSKGKGGRKLLCWCFKKKKTLSWFSFKYLTNWSKPMCLSFLCYLEKYYDYGVCRCIYSSLSRDGEFMII